MDSATASANHGLVYLCGCAQLDVYAMHAYV
jgi:hypothetical protein